MNKFKTSFGEIKLSDVELIEDSISICIDINEVSQELNRFIDVAILKTINRYEDDYCMLWKFPAIDCIYLSVDLYDTKILKTVIHVYFYDKANENLEGDISIDVNLSDYLTEIKQLVVKAVVNKFFN